MPVAKKPTKAESEGLVSGGVRTLPKKVTVETVREWTNSVYLAKNIKDFGVQIYPEPPTITVTNDDTEEEVPELSKEIARNFKEVRAWAYLLLKEHCSCTERKISSLDCDDCFLSGACIASDFKTANARFMFRGKEIILEMAE